MAGSNGLGARASLDRGRDGLAIAAARVVSSVARRTGHGGTSLPGLVAERVAPGILARLAGDLQSFVLVSGTNGKTTTTRLLVHVLEQAGRKTVTNASGANMRQAITSTLVSGTGLNGHHGVEGALAVLEVDEATLPRVAESLPVSLLLATNLFRDQLDRYGETDEIVRRWRGMLARLPLDACFVFCADDPRMADLAAVHRGTIRDYGLSEPPPWTADTSLTPDLTTCPRCESRLVYAWSGIGHLGAFACERCGFARGQPWLRVRVIRSRGIEGQTLGFRAPGLSDELCVDLALPGTSNAYNAAAAVATATALGVRAGLAVDALASATSAWGRYEQLEIDGRRVILTLGKNPASLAELVRIGAELNVSGVLFALNDGFPDGRDVSWYWDVNPVALFAGTPIAISGTRADDFRLRLKYELGDRHGDGLDGLVGMYEDPAAGLDGLLAATSPGDTIFAVATYTALLQLRQTLFERGLVAETPR